MKSYLLWEYTSNQIRDMSGTQIFVQPIGSIEQHGPHLPLGTDSMIVSAFVERLIEKFQETDFPAIFLPLMPYGKSNEHLNYPGTITYSLQTLINVLMDIGRSCARAGVKKFVFLNGHGGNHEVLDMIARELRIETGMQVFILHPLLKIMPDAKDALSGVLSPEEEKLGIHAGRVETAVILRLYPDLVHTELAQCDYPANFDGCEYLDFSEKIPFGWMTQDVSKTGTIGNPLGATSEEGEKWLSGVTNSLYRAFLDIKNTSPLK